MEDNKANSSNLVREQDFILRVRSMKRLTTKYLVVNLLLGSIEPSHGLLEEAQQRVQIFAESHNCTYHEMSNGDVFLTCLDTSEASEIPILSIYAAFTNNMVPEDVSKYIITFHMPNDYTILRERSNYYVEESRTSSALGENGTPAQILKSDAARGALTAWSLNQIENLLRDIDLQNFLRTQPVCEILKDGTWAPLYEECFIGFEDLKHAYFPKLEISASEHLFMELCQSLDGRILVDFTQRFDNIRGKKLSLNLSVATVMGTIFAQFSYVVPRSHHGNINFELNRGDLLQDFPKTLSAISMLKREGFKVSIDDVTPDMLAYVNFSSFETDNIKLNVSKPYSDQINSPVIQSLLAKIPQEKLIFHHCDNEQALNAGISIGVTKFQGWLIDELMSKTTNKVINLP